MSILHQSLERLKRGTPRERAPVSGGLPGLRASGGYGLFAASRGRSVSLASALLFCLGLAALLFSLSLATLSRGVRWLEQGAGCEVERHEPAAMPTSSLVFSLAPPAAPPATPRSASLPAPRKLDLGEQSTILPTPGASDSNQTPQELTGAPSESLEAYFAAQARRNQALLEQERAMAKTYAAGDKEAAQKELREYLQRVGHNSVAATRWKAYQALKEGRYAEAEALCRELLSKNSDDSDSAYNFLLALLRQNKKGEAAAFHARYMRGHSLDERVGSLTPLLTK